MKTRIIIILSIFIIISFAISIDTYSQNFLVQKGLSGLNNDIFYKTLGGFKDYLSDMSYIKADKYYHGGVYDFHEEKPTKNGLHIEEEAEHIHDDIHDSEHDHAEDNIKSSSNILLAIGKEITITEHRHLSGNEKKEIVPWLYYAVKLNPHNESAYSLGGFWLAVKLKKVDAAIKFLKEGFIENPNSWEICATLGQIYFINKKDYNNAKDYFEKAKELGEVQSIDKFEKRKIYTFLAESYKKTGNINKAKKLYKELSILFPNSNHPISN